MNRRILIQVTAPAVLIGLVLLGACLAGVRSVHRLQSNLAGILSENVSSLEAAQELVIQLRQLRFHTLLVAMDPTPERRELVEEDLRGFEAALEEARWSANRPDEQALVEEVRAGYDRYRAALAAGPSPGPATRDGYLTWADAHPVRHLVEPCQELLRVNKAEMERAARESEAVSSQASTAMLALGLAGPLAGLIVGFGITRGLTRSIAQLRVRVQDVHAELDQDVGSLRLAPGDGLRHLDRQLGTVLDRVRAVVGQLHRQQQEILRAEQLGAVGQLAASVAHEVRNPLMAIKMLVGSALRGGGRALTDEDLRVIHGEVVRLEQTAQTLLDFARPPEPRREPCDLRGCIAHALEVVRVRCQQQGVAVEVRQPDAPLVSEADRGQMGTVLVNLLLNALDAMPRGGRLEVELAASGGEARLTVLDSGGGIDPAMTGRLFTPFASTKPTGTGLGLSICRRVVEQHGGTVTAAGRPGGGACFLVSLPVLETEAADADLVGRR